MLLFRNKASKILFRDYIMSLWEYVECSGRFSLLKVTSHINECPGGLDYVATSGADLT